MPATPASRTASATPQAPRDSQPIDTSTLARRQEPVGDAPQPMRPATPPSVAAVSARPAATSDQCSDSVR